MVRHGMIFLLYCTISGVIIWMKGDRKEPLPVGNMLDR